MPEDYVDTRELPKEKTRIDREALRWHLTQVISTHVGEANRIDRENLVSQIAWRLGIRVTTRQEHDRLDRVVRDEISNMHTLSEAGARICSSKDEGGYFIGATDDELDKDLAIEEGRGMTILQNVRIRRRLVNMESPAQIRMDLTAPAYSTNAINQGRP